MCCMGHSEHRIVNKKEASKILIAYRTFQTSTYYSLSVQTLNIPVDHNKVSANTKLLKDDEVNPLYHI